MLTVDHVRRQRWLRSSSAIFFYQGDFVACLVSAPTARDLTSSESAARPVRPGLAHSVADIKSGA